MLSHQRALHVFVLLKVVTKLFLLHMVVNIRRGGGKGSDVHNHWFMYLFTHKSLIQWNLWVPTYSTATIAIKYWPVGDHIIEVPSTALLVDDQFIHL